MDRSGSGYGLSEVNTTETNLEEGTAIAACTYFRRHNDEVSSPGQQLAYHINWTNPS